MRPLEVSAARLRMRDPVRSGWVEYPRDQIGSVRLRDGSLRVTDRSGNGLITERFGGKARKLRRALERHSWIEPTAG